jgi:uncharacterized delta-60 repeat protein
MKYRLSFVGFILLFTVLPLIPADSITNAQAQAVTLQSDGKVIAAGSVMIKNSHKLVVSRYNSDGSLDISFGMQGLITTSIGTDAQATGLVVDTNNQIMVCGYAFINSMTHLVVAQYTSAGVLDTEFAQDGIFSYLEGNGCAAQACKKQSDGKIILAGAAVVDGVSNIIVMRLTTNGTLDSTFGNNGIILMPIALGGTAQAITINNSDQIYLGGFARRWDAWQPVLIKLTADGILDTQFGENGIAWISVGTDAGVRDMVLDAQENSFAIGFVDGSLLIFKTNSDGALDNTFGNQGIVIKNWGITSEGVGISSGSDNSIFIAANSDANAIVVKYSSMGILDSSFADNGSLLLPNCQAADLVTQNDGKIVAAASNETDLILARYLVNGNLDVSWGTLGLVNDPSGVSTTIPVFITDTKSIGSNGGTFTAGSWQVRDLNTISSVNNSIAIAQNQIIIQPGTYTFRISAPAYRVGLHQIRLQNVTENQTLAYGASAIANANGSITFSTLEANITVTKVTNLQVQHRCTTTEENDGYGIAGGFGDEIYTTVKIMRI